MKLGKKSNARLGFLIAAAAVVCGLVNLNARAAEDVDPFAGDWAVAATTQMSGGQPVSYDAATNFVAATLSSAGAPIEVRGVGRLLAKDEVRITAYDTEIESPFERFWFVFADDAPGALWSHPCRYVCISEDGRTYAVREGRFWPEIVRKADGKPIWMLPSVNARPPVSLAAVKRAVYAATPKDACDLSKYYAGDISHSYFFLFCGGQNAVNNHIFFWADTAMFYSTLTKKYKVPADHIRVLMSDGLSDEVDACLGEYSNGEPILVSSPTDLDGDGVADVNGTAYFDDMSRELQAYASSLTADDQLFVFMTSHGALNMDGTKSAILAHNGGRCIWDYQIAEWSKDIPCPVAFAIQACNSGGFVDDLTAIPNRMVATACRQDEYAWGNRPYVAAPWSGSGIGKTGAYSTWARQFNSAVRGFAPASISGNDYPWNDGASCAAAVDADGDGRASFSEAATYATAHDENRNVEHPQYGESAAGLGAKFFVLKPSSGESPSEDAPDERLDYPFDAAHTIICFGDSLTYGQEADPLVVDDRANFFDGRLKGVTKTGCYPYWLSGLVGDGYNVISQARGGMQTDMITAWRGGRTMKVKTAFTLKATREPLDRNLLFDGSDFGRLANSPREWDDPPTRDKTKEYGGLLPPCLPLSETYALSGAGDYDGSMTGTLGGYRVRITGSRGTNVCIQALSALPAGGAAIAAGEVFTPDAAAAPFADAIHVIMAGANDGASKVDTYLPEIAATVAKIPSGRYLVVSPPINTATYGSTDWNQRYTMTTATAVEQKFADRFGDHYLNLRAALAASGDWSGLVASDGVHMSTLGYKAIASLVNEKLRALGYVAPPTPAEPTPLKVLAIGNSFSRQVCDYLGHVKTSLGVNIDFMNLYIGSGQLLQHWNGHDKAGTYNEFNLGAWETAGSPVTAMTPAKNSLDDVLAAEQWDVVTLQQASNYSTDLSSFEPYFGNLVNLIRTKAPTAKIYVHQTWSWSPRHAEISTYEDSDAMYDELRANYASVKAAYNLDGIIPSGFAAQLCRHLYSHELQTSDGSHFEMTGKYMQACLWAGVLTGKDVTTVADLPNAANKSLNELSPALYEQLRDCAQRASVATDLTAYKLQPIVQPRRIGLKRAASVSKSVWTAGEAAATVTAPTFLSGDATKTAAFTRNGGTPTAWNGGALPTEPGLYVLTWTVPAKAGYYPEGSTSVSFRILAAGEDVNVLPGEPVRTATAWGYTYAQTVGQSSYGFAVFTDTSKAHEITLPSGVQRFDALVVGGGGGGGIGGGGGGEVVERLAIAAPSGALTVRVGRGGAGRADVTWNSSASLAESGTASSLAATGFATLTAGGGGAGADFNNAGSVGSANGGGGAPRYNYNVAAESAPGQGTLHNGGLATSAFVGGGGGGGAGAGADGGDSAITSRWDNNQAAGDGGAGVLSAITGKTYGGGGGGGIRGRVNDGGLGVDGGGNGSTAGILYSEWPVAATAGEDGRGGGGGGGGLNAAGGNCPGAKGGDGVVILRWEGSGEIEPPEEPTGGFDPYVEATDTLEFRDATQPMDFVADKDYTVAGIIFANGTQTRISGGHTITLQSTNDELLDKTYKRLFLGNTELTVTDGTDVLINPKDYLQQSSNMKIVVEDGATFTNTKWGAGDNGGYVLVASNENSAITLDLISANSGNTDPGVTFTFIAQDCGKVEVNKKNSALINVGAKSNQKLTAVADNGTVALTGVRVTSAATGDVTLAGSGTAAFDTFTPAGGTLTLVPDAEWNLATPHLTTTGSLTFKGEVAVDASALGVFSGARKLLVGQAGGTATLNPSKVSLTGAAEGVTASCSAEGKNVYLTLTAPVAPPAPGTYDVTLESLLGEMTDAECATRLAEHPWTGRLWSSYDRRSVSPEDAGTWFANDDRSNFVATNTANGRTEYVMVDAKGPGALTRLWTANGYGTVYRFYVDGATTPVITGVGTNLIGGHVLCGAPLADEVSPRQPQVRRAQNLYLPIPYSSSLVVTAELKDIPPDDDPARSIRLWYNAEVRTYASDVRVEPFSSAVLARAQSAIAAANAALRAQPEPATDETKSLNGALAAGVSRSVTFTRTGGAIRSFSLKLADGDDPLRTVRVKITFDGETTVDAAVGHLFGAGYAATAYATVNGGVAADGTLTLRQVMPFAESCTVTLENTGRSSCSVVASSVAVGAYDWDADRSLHFGAFGFEEKAMPTRRGAAGYYDLNWVRLQGCGYLVGNTLALDNSGSDKWWGEGDEKIYVDGEAFPSYFGTGTEDFFGYAWGHGEPFTAHPFLALPISGSVLTAGRRLVTTVRTRRLDAVPFATSLKLDVEVWHQDDCTMDYAPATLWYARPGVVITPGGLDPVDANIWAGRKVSVVGDSYSSCDGFCTGVHAFYPDKTHYGIASYGDMWWAQAIAGLGGTPSVNCSDAGSYITRDTDDRDSFITRLGASSDPLGSPDVILSFGGLNDCWNGVPLKAFVAGLRAYYAKLNALYPNAEKYALVPPLDPLAGYVCGPVCSAARTYWAGGADYRDALKDVSVACGFKVVDLDGAYDGSMMYSEGGATPATWCHPKKAGMTAIAERVMSVATAVARGTYAAPAHACVFGEDWTETVAATASSTGTKVQTCLCPTASGGVCAEHGLVVCKTPSTRYATVEYIEATGAQYVDTGITVQPHLASEITFEYTALVSGQQLFAGTPQLDDAAVAGVKYDFTGWQSDSHLHGCAGGIGKTSGIGATASSAHNFLFAKNSGGTAANYAKVKLYGAKIYTQYSTLVRSYVPCYDTVNAVHGLWDEVSGAFVASATATAFTGPASTPVESDKLVFAANETTAYAMTQDRTLKGLVFGNGSKVTISGGHTLTLVSEDDKLMDGYERLFCGDTELTMTGTGTAVTVNPKVQLGQSSNTSITAADGASFANTKWNFSDNGGYTLVATGEGSLIAMTLQNEKGWHAVDAGYRFEASDGATLKITRGNYSLDFNNANHGLVVTADGGTATLTGVKVTKGAPTVTLAGGGTAAFDTFTPAGGKLTLKPDAEWNLAMPHLTTTGNLTFKGEVAVDASALGSFTGTRKILVGQAGGTATLNPSKVSLTGAAEGVTASCSVEGKNAYLTLTAPVPGLPPVGQRKLGMFLDYAGSLPADFYCDFVRDYLAPNGFDTLVLLIDMNFGFESRPNVGDGRTTKEDVAKMAAACREHGIELIPALELLGHQSVDRSYGILKVYPELDESYSKATVEENYARSLCPKQEKSFEVACDLMDDLVAAAGSKAIHICCDEVFEIGVCDLCKGTDHGQLFADWVNALNRHNRANGVETMIWGDRLIKRSGTPYSKWEASENGTDTALALLDKDIVICDWHYESTTTFPSVELFTEAGFKTWICPYQNLESAKKFIDYADAHEVGGNVAGVMLTVWVHPLDYVAALRGDSEWVDVNGTRKPVSQQSLGCAAVFNGFKRPVEPPEPPVGTAYWRWTSNATADDPTWHEVDGGGVLSVPAFEGSTAADNVIELLHDCKVSSILTFDKSCTIRTQPDLDVKKVQFTSADVYCLVGNAAVKTLNVTFDGNNVGSTAWGLKKGGGSLTLGDGVTVCNFKPKRISGIDGNFSGAILIAGGVSATLNILEGAKICDTLGNGAAVTVGNHTASVVNMSGGEITRCTSTAGDRPGGAIDMDSGTLNLSGGYIHNNTASSCAGGIAVVNDGKDAYIKVSGNPIVRDNYQNQAVANVGLTFSKYGTGHFILAGDLTAGAYIGCSYNIGLNKEFGVADGEYAGAQRIHADGSELVGKRDSAKLVWATASEPLPTVGGQEVEPDKVFDLAREAKPITYPSAPEVSGAEGSQRIDFGGISVEVPRHYTASVEGSVVTIKLNRNAEPTIADSDDGEKKGIALKDGQVKIHFEPQAEGLFYTLETATEPQGEWAPAKGPQAETDFSVQVDGEKRFYRIKVSD